MPVRDILANSQRPRREILGGTVHLDSQGRVLHWSHSLAKWTGIESNQALGRPLVGLIHLVDSPSTVTTTSSDTGTDSQQVGLNLLAPLLEETTRTGELSVSLFWDAPQFKVAQPVNIQFEVCQKGEQSARILLTILRVESPLGEAGIPTHHETLLMSLLAEAAGQLLEARDPATLVRDLYMQFCEPLQLDGYFHYVLDQESNTLSLASYEGISFECAEAFKRLEIGQGICGTAALNRTRLYISDLQASEFDFSKILRESGFAVCVCFPLLAESRLLGTLAFVSRNRRVFELAELSFFETLSYYLAVTHERLRTERVTRISEARLRTLASGTAQEVWISNRDGSEVEILAATEAQVTLNCLLPFDSTIQRLHKDDRREITEQISKAFANGQEFEIRGRWQTPVGKWQSLVVRAVPLHSAHQTTDANRTIEGWIGTTADVTRQFEKDLEIRSTLSKLEMVLQSAKMGVWEWNLVDDRILWSKEVYEILETEEFDGTMASWSQMIHEDDRKESLLIAEKAIKNKLNLEHDFRIRTSRGNAKWVSNFACIEFDSDDRPVRMIGTVQDITERKNASEALRESEERFRQLAENVDDLFWIGDPVADKVVYASPAFDRIWQISREQFLADPSLFLRSIHPEDVGRVQEKIAQQKAGQNTILEYRILRPDNSIRWIRDRGFPLLDSEGNVFRIVGIARDITENVLALERLASQQAELLHVGRLRTLGLMSATLSHELNQPLSALANFATASLSLVQQSTDAFSQQLQNYVEEIARQSLRAGEIVRGLRDFSRKSAPKRIPCDLPSILRDCVSLMKMELRPRHVQVEWQIEADLPHLIADRVQLQQVFVNLLSNAAEAMENTAVEDRVITVRAYLSVDSIVIEIDDHGIGISESNLSRIFEPFFSCKPQGSGLGLSICRSIIEDHQGKIKVTNRIDHGVRVAVELPVTKAGIAKD